MHELRELNIREIETIYNEYMRKDFPKDELKPLIMIKKALKKERYVCLGLFVDNDITGYAFFATLNNKTKKYCLLDYFAIVSDRRCSGYGSQFLNLLKEKFAEYDIVICETENPDSSEGDEKNIRQRRISFYKKNGFIDTKVRANVFGVDFILLEPLIKTIHNTQETETAYSELYHSFLPSLMYKRFFKITK